MTKEHILMAAGIGLLAVVAVLGWTRRAGTAPQILPQTVVMYPASQVADVPSYAEAPSVRTISPAGATAAATEPGYAPSSASERAYADGSAGGPQRRVVTHERPLSHSLEIVGGGAGAGAAIGAVAGGGKGAGIGALSGGAAGFIYDRLTHKKQVAVQQ